jgi:hypothetical protein
MKNHSQVNDSFLSPRLAHSRPEQGVWPSTGVEWDGRNALTHHPHRSPITYRSSSSPSIPRWRPWFTSVLSKGAWPGAGVEPVGITLVINKGVFIKTHQSHGGWRQWTNKHKKALYICMCI